MLTKENIGKYFMAKKLKACYLWLLKLQLKLQLLFVS